MKSLFSLSAILVFGLTVLAQVEKTESVYSSLLPKNCKVSPAPADDGIVYKAVCKGVGGFKIDSFATEHTAGFDLITPAGRTIELDIRSAISSAAPSALGDKVEWRVKRSGRLTSPFALIARVNLFDDPNDSTKRRSFLAVVKIGNDQACVIGIVAPDDPDQNVRARKLADGSAVKPCVTEH